MHDDFEKEISHRMQEFRISPQPGIWQQVEAALPPERRRRSLFWWWLLPVLCLLLAGICLVRKPHLHTADNKRSRLHPVEAVRQTTGTPGSEDPQAATAAANEVRPEADLLHTQRKEDHPPAEASAVFRKSVLQPATTGPAGNLSRRGGTHLADTIRKERLSVPDRVLPSGRQHFQASMLRPEHPEIPVFIPRNHYKAENSILPAVIPEKSPSATGTGGADRLAGITVDSLASIPPVLPRQEPAGMLSHPDTTDSLPGKKTDLPAPDTAGKRTRRPAAASRKGSWLVVAALGNSWMQGTGNSSKVRYRENTYAFSNPNPATRLYYPKNGLNLAAGIGRLQPFARYWDGQLLLHYQLLTASQVTGPQAVTAGSGGLTNGIDGSRRNDPVYRAGTSMTHRMAVHQLQLAPGIGYMLSAHARFPVRFSTGLFLGWNRHSNLLLHDYRNNSYVQSRQYNQQWTWGASAGASLLIRHRLQAGILYQYHFTNVGKPAVRSDFRWRQLQFQLVLPVF